MDSIGRTDINSDSKSVVSSHDRDLDSLLKKAFPEYDSNIFIDFHKIKDFLIVKNKKDNPRDEEGIVIKEFILICDELLGASEKKWKVNQLESLAEDKKRNIAKLFLSTFSLDEIYKEYGSVMILRLWSQDEKFLSSYYEGEFIAFWKKTLSIRTYYLIKKATNAESRLNNKQDSFHSLIKRYIVLSSITKDILSEDIQEFVKKSLGGGFSLRALSTMNDRVMGIEENRHEKDIYNNGKEIAKDAFDATTKYKKIRGVEREVVNRNSKDIYKDWSGSLYKIYLDSPVSFGLFYNDLPIAVASFFIRGDHTLFINQMQTVSAEYYDRYGRKTKDGVDPIVQDIPREDTLYDILSSLAKKYGCTEIAIQSGENNKRTQKKKSIMEFNEEKGKLVTKETDIPHLSLSIAQKIYDVFAEKKGFTKDNKSHNRYKKI